MPDESAVEKRESWRPLIVIALSMVMMYITSFGVNVLISAIVTDLGTTVSTLQAVIVSASLIAGSLMVTAGRLGDKFGRKKIFILGVIIYTAGMTLVVLSPNTTVFAVAWGVIWPSGMVLLIPTSISLIMYFYHGSQRAIAFGAYGAILSAVSALAPLLIGALSGAVGWRLALSLSPIAGLATLALAFTMRETDKDESIRIDIPSVLLSLLGFGTLLVATTLAGHYGWFLEKRPLVIAGSEVGLFGLSVVPYLYLVGFALLLAFLGRGSQLKSRGGEALLDASLLKNVPFSIGMTMGALLFLVIAGVLFSVSVFLQAGAGFDGLQTALTTLPLSALIAVFSFATPNLGKKIAPKWIVAVGCAIGMAGIWFIGRHASVGMEPMDVLLGMALFGTGAGLIMAQVASVTMSTVPPEQSGAASGLSETMKEIVGQGFAIALAGSILFGAVYSSMVDSWSSLEGTTHSATERERVVIELEDRFQQITEEGEAEFVASLPEKSREKYPEIVAGASEAGLRSVLSTMNVFLVLCLLLSFLLPAKKLE